MISKYFYVIKIGQSKFRYYSFIRVSTSLEADLEAE
jgi:hypothetical protein